MQFDTEPAVDIDGGLFYVLCVLAERGHVMTNEAQQFWIYANDADSYDVPDSIEVVCYISEISAKAREFCDKIGRRVAVAEMVCGEYHDVLTVGDWGCFLPTKFQGKRAWNRG